ncbi:MAG: alpha-L-fucosidase [Verrucomicrobia bacterium]|nr:alpha-L-fucosidase [Verrucomicrobiota bacterium]MCH8510159.1 alpha-L-fucosidase [Kiritimatiellia bacterium]
MNSALPNRHVHLDFHTSPFIPGVGADFDPEEFAKTMAEARVQNVNIFAKCHHGMSYYPTKIGKVHPHLTRPDLMGEMIEALHRRGIRCPLYTPVVWEEHVADTHPEWRQMFSNGRFAQISTSADAVTSQPGGWRFNAFTHPDYQDYFEAHLAELFDNYDVDGVWIDILFMENGACFNDASRKLRTKWNLEADTPENNTRFESLAQEAFCQRFTRFIHGRNPKAAIFYNSTNRAFVNHNVGWTQRAKHVSHFEIESLPSGFWGYFHYPRLARQAMTWDLPFVGMTGRFQKMWGDFGGLKPKAALEFECFRTQATGGACCVGDQMHPRGQLDQSAYRMIGEVYQGVEAAEPFYEGTRPLFQGGVLLSASPGMNETLGGQSEEGAVLMCDELKIDVAVLDDAADLTGMEFLILPDSTPVDEQLKAKLAAYHAGGGKLILSHTAGCDRQGKWQLDFLPIRPTEPDPKFPSYWRSRGDFAPAYGEDARVIYQQGMRVETGDNTRILVDRVESYFNRSDLKFCSHFQTPPDLTAPTTPAVVAGEGFVYFADPVFREYRQAGNVFLRDILQAALQTLEIAPLIGEGLDPHVIATARTKDNDLHLTLLNYIPSRKSMAIDVIERGLTFAGQTLRLSRPCAGVKVFPDNTPLTQNAEGSYNLPERPAGRLLLRITDFHRSSP